MDDIQDYFSELRKYGYCDDDIRAEDNTDITKEVDTILRKYKTPQTQTHKIVQRLVERKYVDEKEFGDCFGFTLAYILYK